MASKSVGSAWGARGTLLPPSTEPIGTVDRFLRLTLPNRCGARLSEPRVSEQSVLYVVVQGCAPPGEVGERGPSGEAAPPDAPLKLLGGEPKVHDDDVGPSSSAPVLHDPPSAGAEAPAAALRLPTSGNAGATGSGDGAVVAAVAAESGSVRSCRGSRRAQMSPSSQKSSSPRSVARKVAPSKSIVMVSLSLARILVLVPSWPKIVSPLMTSTIWRLLL
mmetsp:Transcript_91278/g.293175  ORF Transcript_91278/g.293175 Transcript_91278/m.293175 type:complete len:219 (-) Transcript_91278:1380-2036(-)